MKRNWTAAVLLSGATALGHGAEVSDAQRAKIEQKLAGTDNPLSLYGGKLVFDVQERLRLEMRDNNFDFNDDENLTTDDTYLLQRFRLGATYKPVSWLRTYVQGQDTREFDSARRNVPFVLGAEGDDPIDLRQGFIEAGNPAEFPLIAKVGRQELIYGDERLIGAFDWNNFSRTFDAVKLRYQRDPQKFWVDAFVAHVVTIEAFGPNENTYLRFNDSNWEDTFAGIYASLPACPKQSSELYFLYRNKADSDPLYIDELGNRARAYDIEQEIYTLGARFKSLPGALAGFDYEVEGAYQFGRDAGRVGADYPNPAGDSLEHQAFAFETRVGYTLTDVPWKPRFGLEYSVASGDSDPADDKDESFLNLFPTNHKFYGYMDLFAWKNIHNPSVSLKLTPHEKVSVQVDGHAFWLYTNDDAWYRANGVATIRPLDATARDADTFVGTEVDLTVGYNPVRFLRILAGYSHFFAGNYLDDTSVGGAGNDDADFAYVQTMFTF